MPQDTEVAPLSVVVIYLRTLKLFSCDGANQNAGNAPQSSGVVGGSSGGVVRLSGEGEKTYARVTAKVARSVRP